MIQIAVMTALLLKLLQSSFVSYILRCLAGFLIGYFFLTKLDQHNFFWCLLSIVLVISPEEKDTKKLTIERVKANIVGSIAGLLVHFSPIDDNYFKIIVGILISIFICRGFKLMNVARSSVVALLIVLIENQGDSYHAPFYRAGFVTLGCFTGLAVSYLIAYSIRYLRNILEKRVPA